MELDFIGEVIYWRGPSPWHFAVVPEAQSAEIEAASPAVTYGWGVIPVVAQVGDVSWQTSLIPKDGVYLLPIRADVRRGTGIELGDRPEVRITIDL